MDEGPGRQRAGLDAVLRPRLIVELRKAELRKNAVRTGEVLDRSLLEQDFAPGQLPAGEQGRQGEPGEPGEDATKLFAYIRDNGPADHASVQYGSGVTGVGDVDVNTSTW